MIGSSRVPFSTLAFFGDAGALDGPGMMGWDKDIAREGGIGPEDRAAATEADGARTTFFDLGFLAAGALWQECRERQHYGKRFAALSTYVFKRATCPLET